jgi:hypothetical protein
MNNFKVGDKVKCIRGTELSSRLVVGSEYVVTGVYAYDVFVELAGGDNGSWQSDRFELVLPEFKKMQFLVESDEHAEEIQEALFALGYTWQAGETSVITPGPRAGDYIHTGMWGEGKMIYNQDLRDVDLYVVKDGKVEKYIEPKKVYGNMKFRIYGSLHSQLVQDTLFAAGYKWLGRTAKHDYLDAQFLYAEDCGDGKDSGRKYISYSYLSGTDDVFFEETAYQEMQLVAGEFVPVIPELEVDPRPPLGLRPRYIADIDRTDLEKQRLVEILEAMLRYAKAGKAIPDAWDDEYDAIRELLNEEYSH